MVLAIGYQPPAYDDDEKIHRRRMSEAFKGVYQGKINVTLDVTLAPSTASTTIQDSRISPFSAISPAMALTANGAAALASLYIPLATITKGQAVIQHANNAQTDRVIRFVILG
jgi:hypothetical protein